MKRHFGIITFAFLSIFFLSSSVQADWINLTGAQNARNIAEIYVNDDHVKLVLEVHVGDLSTFEDLLPDDFFKKGIAKRPPVEERMKQFSQQTFRIIADQGVQLLAELKVVEPRMRKERPNPFAGMINPITRQPVPGPPVDKRVLYVELVYPFPYPPKELVFIPALGTSGIPSVSIGFIAYHKGVPVVDYRYLSEAARLHLDWEDPWYSRFENKALKRWQMSGVRTFLYIEPYEVRHETLVRVKDMAAWIDLDLRGKEYIEEDEFEPLKKKIGEFLLQHSNVLIDGQSRRPILDRTSFVKYTMTRTYFIDQPERMQLNTAMVGVIITYLTKGIPQEVTVDWDLFSDRIQKVPTSAVDPVGPFPSYVTPDDNVLKWTNFLKTYQMPTVAAVSVDPSLSKLNIPVGSILCLLALVPLALQIPRQKKAGKPIVLQLLLSVCLLGGTVLLYPFLKVAVARPAVMVPEIKNEEAVAVLDNLLKNVYRSFDFREEEDVYDRLETSVSGDLLEEIYLQNRKSLVVTQAGGAQAKVKEVKILDVDVEKISGRSLGRVLHAQWTAMGTVGHWGHIHTRQNQYNANITIDSVDGVWKITDLELLEEKRIDQYSQPVVSKS